MLRTLRTLSRQLEADFLSPLSTEERAELHALLLRLAQKHEPGCARAKLIENDVAKQ
jgi:hypothetical protein